MRIIKSFSSGFRDLLRVCHEKTINMRRFQHCRQQVNDKNVTRHHKHASLTIQEARSLLCPASFARMVGEVFPTKSESRAMFCVPLLVAAPTITRGVGWATCRFVYVFSWHACLLLFVGGPSVLLRVGIEGCQQNLRWQASTQHHQSVFTESSPKFWPSRRAVSPRGS